MTRAEVIRLLEQTGLRPQQAAGQNFLLDESVAEAMVDAADVQAGEKILEIGPGLGMLTEALSQRGANVTAVELDERLSKYLQQKYQPTKNVTIVPGDIFRVNLHEYVADGQYKLVANLPYSSTSLVFRNFLSQSPRPTSITVMIQRDVAERIVAEPGQLSMLALTVQYYSRPSLLFDVPAESFTPKPKVVSAVLHCEVTRPIQSGDRELFRVMRAGFSARRKQLKNTLSASLHRPVSEVADIMKKMGIGETARAQELTMENWLDLAKNFS